MFCFLLCIFQKSLNETGVIIFFFREGNGGQGEREKERKTDS